MKIAVLRERTEGESRVAATPETVAKLIGLGAGVTVEKGAGSGSRIADEQFSASGATIGADARTTLAGADIVLVVRRPAAADLAGVNPGALLIGALDPYGNDGDVAALAKAGVTAMVMEFMPRITRAQVMDILSSQANLAGYQAVIEAASVFDRAMPMMMTAAGTVRPAKAFVMGAGVAGLQAIATAKRLGAVVSATDVRAAAGEQVESLGAKFIMTEALKDASGTGGYARELTKDEQAAQAELVAGHISKQDIVITTALIPGRPAPKLVTRAMVESMAPGSVIVDLAAERGGNVELTQPGKVIDHNGVVIIGYTNLAGRIPTTASQLYARNLLSFIDTLVDKKEKKLAINWDDELVKATVLTRNGAVVHPNFVAAAKTGDIVTAPSGAVSGDVVSAKPKPAPKKPAAKAEPKDAPVKTGAAKKPAAIKKTAPKAEAAPAPEAVVTPAPAVPVVAKKAPARKPATPKADAVAKEPAAKKPASKKPAAKPEEGK
ncbi:Re/Si-specific NAD(P)(+) transhydrogenase subunit alpha [Devosia sp. 63-57]|uniref:Re/Si-specific NAD(P)(+) transhydrogenase subunit alpha n=1 Tax=Devosia sp. 63-57 TaxID=1895751 RepID=UPI00086B41BE|nr:Re/Si-specific NAD(P)(+) transhydrogenase subunit alpha [Devosia sp. 63-57]ODT48918.1 MAG: NAD(P) transhydrogenase subunit alpha [Pelagibacterium sp. SCN 63-126]ODU89311.1 MAG: NAD(P) transhydrogenase subunit alpha [Pelagibacterium sp. SCN 63-17]OJX44152.1 MAG: NAD(P) transhydrogenase subunit alpha [Devosia sp. 63-57]